MNFFFLWVLIFRLQCSIIDYSFTYWLNAGLWYFQCNNKENTRALIQYKDVLPYIGNPIVELRRS